MNTLRDEFMSLSAERKRAVHLLLCRESLEIWKAYCDSGCDFSYIETVCGTSQSIDPELPDAALRSVIANTDLDSVATRYQEPIAALEDDDLEFPDAIEFAYYSIYNLFQRYLSERKVDDWLIVNQAISAHGKDPTICTKIFESAIQDTA